MASCTPPNGWKSLLRETASEFLATMLFVYFGSAGALQSDSFLQVAFSFGISAVAVLYAFGHISAHINPAVTASLMIVRSTDPISGICYIAAQLAGAFFSSFLLAASFLHSEQFKFLDGDVHDPATCSHLSLVGFKRNDDNDNQPNFEPSNAFFFEFIGTVFLCLVVLFRVVSNKGTATETPLAVGLTIFVAHLVLVRVTGCGINPARAFGPSLACQMYGPDKDVAGNEDSYIFYLAPMLGSVVAALIFLAIDEETNYMTVFADCTNCTNCCAPPHSTYTTGAQSSAVVQVAHPVEEDKVGTSI